MLFKWDQMSQSLDNLKKNASKEIPLHFTEDRTKFAAGLKYGFHMLLRLWNMKGASC